MPEDRKKSIIKANLSTICRRIEEDILRRVGLPRWHFPSLHARCGRRVIAVAAPGRMREMDDEVAIVRGDGRVEYEAADTAPVPEGHSLPYRKAVRLTLVGHVDVEGQCPPRHRIPGVVDLGEDFIAEIEILSRNPRLLR